MTSHHRRAGGAAAEPRTKVVVVYLTLLAFNIGAWAWAVWEFADRPVLLGTALLAYSFGLRHAFDADHIAAIDNVVRNMVQEKKQPYAVGAFFSLGHSTVVVVASLVIAFAAAGVRDELDRFHVVGSVIGTAVSALFLLAVGLANLLVLADVWAAFSRVRRQTAPGDLDLDCLSTRGGVMSRLFGRAFSVVSRPWHMYPLGFLFGLGFDTATEIGVLAISAAQATQGASFWTILIFPMLFTAGMSLMDFTDSVLMTRAYGWAWINPVRKLWYNLTITATSVVVALFIGGVEALGLVADKLDLSGSGWDMIRGVNDELGLVGFGIVAFFALAWLVSFLVFRVRRYGDLAPGPAASATKLVEATALRD
ncbi:HoxN/HupN/NixA family nickel/cobalt transporter [Agrobacterium rhizogenes]|nr:HoxN/HupN/NixA family nickel/cobalt transporter [Rhizobium rhizogenes]NTJ81733.1 HoxN/HupN/NixA family nickel/cobalt transporter [Rhizobium rhizogenes]